jgi:ribosome biogenesis GTPase A
VGLQDVDANAPGFYVTPKKTLEAADADADAEAEAEDEAAFDVDAGGYEFDADDDDFDDDDIDETLTLPGYELAPLVDAEDAEAKLDAFNALFDEDDEGAKRRAKKKKKGPPVIVCARCFALRTSGRVKNEAGESLLPSFDFERVIGDRFNRLREKNSAVVLLMVDLIDYDGSFPVDAVDVIEPYVQKGVLDVLLVANKVDLMPAQCTRTRLTSFVRQRSKDFGLSRCSGVHLVSAKAGMGMEILANQLEEMLDRGKEVYVVGAQNAGKSSLINRLSSKYGGPGEEDGGPIASPLPGTTLGMVKLASLLPNGSDVYDTPGLLQPFQLSSRLTGEEMKMVLPNKRLMPRTYRIQVGGTIHIGALARIDLLESPQRTLYLTVWASNKVPTHYSTSAKAADTFLEKHAGTKMTPPLGQERMQQFGQWGSRLVNVYGEDWQKSTRDISIAGLCWIGVACNGNASFRVWTHEGVQVVTREALVPDMDKQLMSPGFSFENVGGGSSGSNKKPNERADRQRGRGGGGGGRGGERGGGRGRSGSKR